jgi:hypothetical protein
MKKQQSLENLASRVGKNLPAELRRDVADQKFRRIVLETWWWLSPVATAMETLSCLPGRLPTGLLTIPAVTPGPWASLRHTPLAQATVKADITSNRTWFHAKITTA